MNKGYLTSIREAIKRWDSTTDFPRFRTNSRDRQVIAEEVVKQLSEDGYLLLTRQELKALQVRVTDSNIALLARAKDACGCTSEDLHCDCTGFGRAIQILRAENE